MKDVELGQGQIAEDAVRNADSQSDSLLMEKNELEASLSEIPVKQR